MKMVVTEDAIEPSNGPSYISLSVIEFPHGQEPQGYTAPYIRGSLTDFVLAPVHKSNFEKSNSNNNPFATICEHIQ